jgi:hypothetical protein
MKKFLLHWNSSSNQMDKCLVIVTFPSNCTCPIPHTRHIDVCYLPLYYKTFRKRLQHSVFIYTENLTTKEFVAFLVNM